MAHTSFSIASVTAEVERVAPLALAEPWDSVGLQIGDRDAAVDGILLAVDATMDVVAQAVQGGHQLLLAHHPLLFSPLTSILSGDPIADVASELIRRDVAFYAAHTNLDVASPLGTAVALAEALGLAETTSLRCGCAGAAGADGEPTGAGRLADLPEATTAQALSQSVARRLAVPNVRLYGDPAAQITRVAMIPGSGGDGLAEAAAAGAGAVITGELKHHELLEARHRGLVVILAGHLHSERPVLGVLQRHLQARLPGLRVEVAREDWPQTTIWDERQA